MTQGTKGTGQTSMERTDTHTIRGWGHWWRSQEELDAYAARQGLIRRARDAGYGLDRLDEFKEIEDRANEGINSLKRREKWIKHEMARLKKKHGLPPRSNRTHLKAAGERTGDPDVRFLLGIMTTATLNDTERILQIRRLFLEGKAPADILYQTALICGINLRKK